METEVSCDNCESVDVISAFDPAMSGPESGFADLYWCPHCGTRTTVSDYPKPEGESDASD